MSISFMHLSIELRYTIIKGKEIRLPVYADIHEPNVTGEEMVVSC